MKVQRKKSDRFARCGLGCRAQCFSGARHCEIECSATAARLGVVRQASCNMGLGYDEYMYGRLVFGGANEVASLFSSRQRLKSTTGGTVGSGTAYWNLHKFLIQRYKQHRDHHPLGQRGCDV